MAKANGNLKGENANLAYSPFFKSAIRNPNPKLSGVCHLFRLDQLIELIRIHKPQLGRGIL